MPWPISSALFISRAVFGPDQPWMLLLTCLGLMASGMLLIGAAMARGRLDGLEAGLVGCGMVLTSWFGLSLVEFLIISGELTG